MERISTELYRDICLACPLGLLCLCYPHSRIWQCRQCRVMLCSGEGYDFADGKGFLVQDVETDCPHADFHWQRCDEHALIVAEFKKGRLR